MGEAQAVVRLVAGLVALLEPVVPAGVPWCCYALQTPANDRRGVAVPYRPRAVGVAPGCLRGQPGFAAGVVRPAHSALGAAYGPQCCWRVPPGMVWAADAVRHCPAVAVGWPWPAQVGVAASSAGWRPGGHSPRR